MDPYKQRETEREKKQIPSDKIPNFLGLLKKAQEMSEFL
jgi:hypothetical protein